MSTYRYKFADNCLINKNKVEGAFIFAVWHENVFGLMAAHAWIEPFLAMASRSKDGDFAAYIASKMGYIPVRGSSRRKNVDKGGKEAAEIYVQQLKLGVKAGITVDGPRGPRQQCKMGIIKIAQLSGKPIIPVAAHSSARWTFNSWDQFKIPKPFSTTTIQYGEPLWVKADATPEELEASLAEVNRRLKSLEPWPI